MSSVRRKLAPPVGLEIEPAHFEAPRLDGIGARLRTEVRIARQTLRAWADQLTGWFRPGGPEPLVLALPDKVVSFRGVAEFEFALASRTEFPAHKVSELIRRPAEDLKRAAVQIRQVEKRFSEMTASSVANPGVVGGLLREVDIKLFSQDHRWRDIIEALNRHGADFDAYKRIALSKYMQYLQSRQAVLQSIYLSKSTPEPEPEAPPAPLRATGSEDTRFAGLTDTAIFDLTQILSPGSDEHFRALPRGETVCLQFLQAREIEIRLSNHRFTLVSGKPFRLVDESGASYVIRPGKNIVGRHAGSDVVIDGSYASVSRKHMIIEPLSDTAALVTDISSHGTFVPPRHVS